MTTLYYILDGAEMLADLSIIDPRSECHCESDILGNMDICGPGTGIHHTPDCLMDDCETELERGSIKAGATYYADTAIAAKWWIAYVDGYNATQDDCEELREALVELDEGALARIIDEMGVDKHLASDDPVGAIIASLHEDYADYESERGLFVQNRDRLRELMAHQ